MPKIPITLTPIPVPSGTKNTDLNGLIALMCSFVEAAISTTVSFFQQGASWPLSNLGVYFNQSLNKFGAWSNALGKYIPVSDLQVGDMKLSTVGGDDLLNGWVVLDGRNINNVAGLTQAQLNNLTTLFGINANIPNYTFLGGLNNIPANGSFNAIPNPAVNPVANTISALTIGGTYSQTEVTALKDNTGQLSNSTSNLQGTVTGILNISDQILACLNGNQLTGPTYRVYVGSP